MRRRAKDRNFEVNRSHYCEQLSAAFGADRFKVCTAHHVQVRTHRGKANHDIWFPISGGVKYQIGTSFKGVQLAQGIDVVIDAIRKADQGHRITLPLAKEAVDLIELAVLSRKIFAKEDHEAVFVDAGWKQGLAQIGCVHLKRVPIGIEVNAFSFPRHTKSIDEAEELAIEYGADWAPLARVYSDSKFAVDRMEKQYPGRLKWISRKRNHVVDQIANMRKRG